MYVIENPKNSQSVSQPHKVLVSDIVPGTLFLQTCFTGEGNVARNNRQIRKAQYQKWNKSDQWRHCILVCFCAPNVETPVVWESCPWLCSAIGSVSGF